MGGLTASPAVCRSCGASSTHRVLDLGEQPLANRLLDAEALHHPEPTHPLRLAVCDACWMLQIEHVVPPAELFTDYPYFSSVSPAFVEHARAAAERYVAQFNLGPSSLVSEIASNDGYFLRYFVSAGVPCFGIEPARNVAESARANGIDTVCEFFGEELAARLVSERGEADLVLGNNVFAHAPGINDFVAGLRQLVAPRGRIVLEFPYGVDMIVKGEFDTIYHEHVFYFTMTSVVPLLARHGLEVYDVERIQLHGGSLRLFVARERAHAVRPSVRSLLDEESGHGVRRLAFYDGFGARVEELRRELLSVLAGLRAGSRRVAAYGASAKGSTLLNFFGLGREAIEFVVDRSPYKQGRFTPGTHLPILPPERLLHDPPDYLVLLTWNFRDEIYEQQADFRRRGGRFIVPIPTVTVE